MSITATTADINWNVPDGQTHWIINYGLTSGTTVSLFDTQGHIIHSTVSHGESLNVNLNELPAGVYFVRIYTTQDTKTVKVIKQ